MYQDGDRFRLVQLAIQAPRIVDGCTPRLGHRHRGLGIWQPPESRSAGFMSKTCRGSAFCSRVPMAFNNWRFMSGPRARTTEMGCRGPVRPSVASSTPQVIERPSLAAVSIVHQPGLPIPTAPPRVRTNSSSSSASAASHSPASSRLRKSAGTCSARLTKPGPRQTTRTTTVSPAKTRRLSSILRACLASCTRRKPVIPNCTDRSRLSH